MSVIHRCVAITVFTLVTTSIATTASAGLIIYEPFDYTPAATPVIGLTNTYSAGSPVWNRAGAAAATVHQVAAGSLTAPSGFPASIGNSGAMMNVDNTEYARLNLPQQFGANSTLYYSL